MYASPTKCTQVGRGVRMQKKKSATEVTVCLALDFTEPSSRGGSPMLSPFVLAKGIISQVRRSFFCSCERSAFLRVGKAHDRFE